MKYMHKCNVSIRDATDEHDVLFILYLITKYNFEYMALCKPYVMSHNLALQFAVLANKGSGFFVAG